VTRLRVVLLISVVVAAPVHGQVSASSDTVKALAKSAGLHVRYDKIEGRTTLRGDKWEVKGNAFSLGPSIDLRIVCVSDGEMIEVAKTTCGLGFTANGGIDWAFSSSPEVTLLADDTVRVRLGESSDLDLSAAGGIKSQSVAVALSVDDLFRLAHAKHIIGRIGRHDFKLGSWSMKELRALAAIAELAHE
jgi:hypothetical protein